MYIKYLSFLSKITFISTYFTVLSYCVIYLLLLFFFFKLSSSVIVDVMSELCYPPEVTGQSSLNPFSLSQD